MRVKLLHKQENDDLAFLFRLQHILSGVLRYARPDLAHLVKVDNWFGPRWRGFAGSRNGKDTIELDRLCIPPFAPKRILSERSFRRDGNHLWRVKPRSLHEEPAPKSSPYRYLDKDAEPGLFIWYSGNTRCQDRGALMVYEAEASQPQRAWFAEFQQNGTTWTVSHTLGTSVSEIDQLETSYSNQLEPLIQRPKDRNRQAEVESWQAALDAIQSSDVAMALVLVAHHRAHFPDDVLGRTLHAMNLADGRFFTEAESEFLSVESAHKSPDMRGMWLSQWAQLCQYRGDFKAEEEARREKTTLSADHTGPWIRLGACLARNGKHEEALAIHRHATELEGDPDEAFLNIGLILRAQGKFEDAAEAFESALRLCPDYPTASKALEDTRAALELKEQD